jgi:hypothetical protein
MAIESSNFEHVDIKPAKAHYQAQGRFVKESTKWGTFDIINDLCYIEWSL